MVPYSAYINLQGAALGKQNQKRNRRCGRVATRSCLHEATKILPTTLRVVDKNLFGQKSNFLSWINRFLLGIWGESYRTSNNQLEKSDFLWWCHRFSFTFGVNPNGPVAICSKNRTFCHDSLPFFQKTEWRYCFMRKSAIARIDG